MKHEIPEEVLREIFQRKIKRRDLNGEIYDKLKKMILSGRFKKGERLIQEELAHGFDVSRTVILHAFAQLEKDKLIVRKYKQGAFVSFKP
jgi:DNA-binding GntR family transcriptional regulator